MNGIWVPTIDRHVLNFQQVRPVEPVAGARVAQSMINVSFEWSAADTTVDSRLLDYHNFNLPIGTEVVDQRGPESIFIEKIGSQRPKTDMGSGLPRSSLHGLIVVINVIGALTLDWGISVWEAISRGRGNGVCAAARSAGSELIEQSSDRRSVTAISARPRGFRAVSRPCAPGRSLQSPI